MGEFAKLHYFKGRGRAETITGGLSVSAVRQVRPDMTTSETLTVGNLVRRT